MADIQFKSIVYLLFAQRVAFFVFFIAKYSTEASVVMNPERSTGGQGFPLIQEVPKKKQSILYLGYVFSVKCYTPKLIMNELTKFVNETKT